MRRFCTATAILIVVLTGLIYPQDRGGGDERIKRAGRPKDKPIPIIIDKPAVLPVQSYGPPKEPRIPIVEVAGICNVITPPPVIIVHSSDKEDGKALLDAGNYFEAISIFSRVIEKNPKDLELYFLLGMAELEYGIYSDAILHFNYYIKFFDDDAEAYFRRGLAYLYFGEKEKAKDDLNTAADLGHERAGNYKVKLQI